MRLDESLEGPFADQLATAAEVGELLGVSSRMVLMSRIKRIRLGPKTIRFRMRDVYDYYGIDEPEEVVVDE